MDETLELNTLLVPTDFSPMSRAAFEQAVKLASGDDATVIVLHVIDSSLAEFAVRNGLATKEHAITQMRSQSESQLSEYAEIAGSQVTVKTMISEGSPFLEIIEKARDLAVDAVVIGKVGTPDVLDKLLFGSTVEKVIRGCLRPVIVLPVEDE